MTTMTTMTTILNPLLEEIAACGYTCKLWVQGTRKHLYIRDERKRALGWINLDTLAYTSERREGTRLWERLFAAQLITG